MNHKAKNNIHKSLTTHKEVMQDLGQLGKDVSLDSASYSMVHSFEERFSIVLYTCKHPDLVNALINRNHAVMLILRKDIVII